MLTSARKTHEFAMVASVPTRWVLTTVTARMVWLLLLEGLDALVHAKAVNRKVGGVMNVCCRH